MDATDDALAKLRELMTALSRCRPDASDFIFSVD
jgi:hypothetical protein